jgi:hypothetical protein
MEERTDDGIPVVYCNHDRRHLIIADVMVGKCSMHGKTLAIHTSFWLGLVID